MFNAKKGMLLIAHPSLIDPCFFKSVVLITHHDEYESIGLTLNHKTNIQLNEIVENIPAGEFPVSIGGPVEKNSIHYIHTLGDKIKNAQKVMDGLYWGGDFEDVITLMQKKLISNEDIRFFAGYSGWEENQLEQELREDSWILKQGSLPLCMQMPRKEAWSFLIKKMDDQFAIWTNLPADPTLN